MRRGVPIRYSHHWAYRGRWRETKISPTRWNFEFNATKRTHAKSMGPKPKSSVVWGIRAKQYAYKTAKGVYQTKMVGSKTLLRARMR